MSTSGRTPEEDGESVAPAHAAGIRLPAVNLFATSIDGVTWTKAVATLDGADDDQALGPGACGVEARTRFEPHVLATADGHLLMFGVMGEGRAAPMQILAATSPDGVDWTRAPGDGALASEDSPGAPAIHSFVALEDDGVPLMLVEVLGDASSALWLARAGR